ncbi:hypothetical protein SZN_29610 [Streptomyces zinciresistens K42]|uniref:Uncharacterized protein n=1 Tax=Streptomyces zinciresistens K42 TaxID=700597 RepID=G2GK79_9ACTN|nr:hypothetical protein SZN_29610 [Streptomyces zinciresistens K42]
MAFYGSAELLAVTAVVRDETGEATGPEAASHRALAVIPQRFRRNRALATLQLATAQLHQRNVDQAAARRTAPLGGPTARETGHHIEHPGIEQALRG